MRTAIGRGRAGTRIEQPEQRLGAADVACEDHEHSVQLFRTSTLTSIRAYRT